MNTTQFTSTVYQWIFEKIIPCIAPSMWQQQLIAFRKGRDWLANISQFADTIKKDENGNIDMEDLKSHIDDIFKINPVFAYPINEPMLELIGVSPEHTLNFSRDDADAFLAYLNGSSTTMEVKL